MHSTSLSTLPPPTSHCLSSFFCCCWGAHLRSKNFHYHNHLFPLLVVVLKKTFLSLFLSLLAGPAAPPSPQQPPVLASPPLCSPLLPSLPSLITSLHSLLIHLCQIAQWYCAMSYPHSHRLSLWNWERFRLGPLPRTLGSLEGL